MGGWVGGMIGRGGGGGGGGGGGRRRWVGLEKQGVLREGERRDEEEEEEEEENEEEEEPTHHIHKERLDWAQGQGALASFLLVGSLAHTFIHPPTHHASILRSGHKRQPLLLQSFGN